MPCIVLYTWCSNCACIKCPTSLSHIDCLLIRLSCVCVMRYKRMLDVCLVQADVESRIESLCRGKQIGKPSLRVHLQYVLRYVRSTVDSRYKTPVPRHQGGLQWHSHGSGWGRPPTPLAAPMVTSQRLLVSQGLNLNELTLCILMEDTTSCQILLEN